MLKSIRYIIVLIFVLLASCAKRGTITGGLKDTIPPIMTSSFPKNYSKNFTGNVIKLNFDEYVKLKNVNKQLIVSPPMKRQLDILPYTASKEITIKIKDTLLPNTTYSFNFGSSIEDNNEANKLQQFKYVFSTGNYIDSLQLNTKVKDAIDKKVANFVSVMLYDATENYTDSIVYKSVPKYLTSTLDSLKFIKFENLKQGKYKLIALKDANGNNKFDPKTDKIGFQKDFITIPNDTVYEIELFKEELPFKGLKVSQASGSKMILGFEGSSKDVKISVKTKEAEAPFVITQFPKKDSLNIWFKANKGDSLFVNVEKNKFKKQFALKLKDQKKDTLSFSTEFTSDLPLRDQFAIIGSVPLSKFDVSKMKLVNKDAVDVKFTTSYDESNQKLKFIFDKEPLEKYVLKVFPKAITDFYGRINDTLNYKFSTSNSSDYGNLRIKLTNVKRFPVIVELTDKEGKIIASQYSEKETDVSFDLIDPALFTLRLIYDDNKNRVWDTGNYIEQRQAEEVIYYPKEIDVRANWDVEQVFDLK
ncbi:MAG: Ig-like domain-containing protein [Flavobacterium sp.]|nr:Ig-like domain-containing protein [Flavobacterium sp.]